MFDFVSAEYSAIGCILIDARCLPVVREHIPAPAAFALEPCQRAYQAACTLADEGKPIDPVTVGRTAGLEREFLVQCMEICSLLRRGIPVRRSRCRGLSAAAAAGDRQSAASRSAAAGHGCRPAVKPGTFRAGHHGGSAGQHHCKDYHRQPAQLSEFSGRGECRHAANCQNGFYRH